MLHSWAVIGAGPAGIAAVGKLIDSGVPEKEILWIDPKFTVGDFGTIWRNIPSNTKVKLFLNFLHGFAAFNYKNCSQDFAINSAEPIKTCYLRVMADPLQWVTNQLKNKVTCVTDTALELSLAKRTWQIKLKNSNLQAKNVILAIGAEPKTLAHPGLTSIPLQDVMDSEKIKNHINTETIAVFGSSHSAVLALRNLVEHKAKKIINFYRSPLCYAVYLDDWILFDDTGLKGPTADWARNNLDGELPPNLIRVYSSQENIDHFLPQCQKAVYAVGFEKRKLPIIKDLGHLSYQEQSGIIAPGLFGFGIAFPEAKSNPFGMLEYRVGLAKFEEYIHRIMPIWLKYGV